MKILAVIPARGGSKGLPRKNVLEIAGRPLIAWTAEAARNAPGISRLICSTEDDEIAAAASAAGCEVPFRRPAELASDSARTAQVVMHALRFFENKGEKFDAVMCLQCTTPLRTSSDIEAAIRLYKESGAKSVVSVCEVSESPYWMYTIGADGRLSKLIDSDFASKSRQGHPKVFRPNGAIYLIDAQVFEQTGSFYDPVPAALVMDVRNSVDIDYEIEFKLAECLLNERIKGKEGR